jgi:fatty acid-binding protein DegV
MSVTVVTDSVACLSPELQAKLGIGVVGIPITLDGIEYRDGVDLTGDQFYARLGETISHKTAAPSVEVEIALFTPVMAASTGPVIGVAWEDPALTGAG